MIFIIIFILVFAWGILKGMDSGSVVESSQDFKKNEIEYVVQIKRETEKEGKILNLIDYLNEKKKREEFERKFGAVTHN